MSPRRRTSIDQLNWERRVVLISVLISQGEANVNVDHGQGLGFVLKDPKPTLLLKVEIHTALAEVNDRTGYETLNFVQPTKTGSLTFSRCLLPLTCCCRGCHHGAVETTTLQGPAPVPQEERREEARRE